MLRAVSLLLGAALLCGPGAFCRRVVSGKSGAPAEGRRGQRLRDAEGQPVPGRKLSGWGDTTVVGLAGSAENPILLFFAFAPKKSEKFDFPHPLPMCPSQWLRSKLQLDPILSAFPTFFVRQLTERQSWAPGKGVG